MKKCPNCGFIGMMEDVDGYVLLCPECGQEEIEDEFEDVDTTALDEMLEDTGSNYI